MSVVSMRRTEWPASSSAVLRITERMRAKVSLSVAFVKMSARQNLVPTWWHATSSRCTAYYRRSAHEGHAA